MLKPNLTSIIIDAQKELIAHPYDLAHDLTHHYRVCQWVLEIAENEKLDVDKNLVIISAWLHDLAGRRGQNQKIIFNLLKKNGCSTNFINKVIIVIREHSFGKKQTTLESKLLYDADKLEYVDPFRLRWFIQAAKDGLIDKEKYLSYKKEWRERIEKVKNTF